MDGRSVTTLTGAEFTATQGIPDLPMGGWLSPDGIFWPCPEYAHLRLAAHIVDHLGHHWDEDDVQNAPGPWLERVWIRPPRIREAERRFRELESERNQYDILVGQLERVVRSDPGQRRDLDAMREKARLAHNQLRKARQELERLSAGT